MGSFGGKRSQRQPPLFDEKESEYLDDIVNRMILFLEEIKAEASTAAFIINFSALDQYGEVMKAETICFELDPIL